jgi:hypothetical protein
MSDVAHFVGRLNLSRFAARLRVERDPTTRSLLHTLLLEEANNLALNLGQLGSLQREVIEGRARISIQMAFVVVHACSVVRVVIPVRGIDDNLTILLNCSLDFD